MTGVPVQVPVPCEPDIDDAGVDLAQIRAMLDLSPAERLRHMTAFMNALVAIRDRNGGSRPA
jgi:hypothetical protein